MVRKTEGDSGSGSGSYDLSLVGIEGDNTYNAESNGEGEVEFQLH